MQQLQRRLSLLTPGVLPPLDDRKGHSERNGDCLDDLECGLDHLDCSLSSLRPPDAI